MTEPRIADLWREIESITPPEPIFLVGRDQVALVPTPEPTGLSAKAAPTAWWATAGLVAGSLVGLIVMAPHLWWLAIGPAAALAGWYVVRGRPRRAERQNRKALLADAEQQLTGMAAEADELGPAGFHRLKGRLAQLRHEYEVEVPAAQRKAVEAFDAQARDRQFQHHMETSWIRDATIVGLGPARKATLEQYGIRSAAQIRAESIQNLPGFGAVLTTSVLAWRETRARTFRDQPQEPSTAAGRAAVAATFDARRRTIIESLQRGRDDLHRLSRLPAGERLACAERLAAAAQAVDQAKLDLATL